MSFDAGARSGMRSSKSEDIRLRYLYRRLVMRGKAKVSLASAKQLVGPDCAYHLYAALQKGKIALDGSEADPGKENGKGSAGKTGQRGSARK
jgi:hypothetical protein